MVSVDLPPPGDSAPNLGVFYNTLGADGRWETHPRYGQVWSPSDPRYAPYVNGHWQWTDYG